ncbi:MAG: preprotein translocase subunit YajC [Paludibacter sp.]|jgi:preprotein translocase subunit YajC|nr:preprotein translocase subunit YajC [Paludibacter sp.]
MNLLSIMLQAAPAADGLSQYSGIFMMVLIFVVFYFFMIRPQSKRQKEIKKQREAMKAGDSVVTSGGIYGKVKDIKDTTVIVEIADNVRIKIDKNSVFATAEDLQSQAK